MADLEQLERAFMKAHKAGDKKAAAVLAKAVKQARTQVAEVTPAQPPEQLQNPFMGRSTDELIALSEQPGITPEQQQQIMDAASANELQTEQRDASPEAVRAFQQRKGQEFAGAAVGGLKQGFREFGAGVAQAALQVPNVVEQALGTDVLPDYAQQFTEKMTPELQRREAELRAQYPDLQGVITGSEIVGQTAPLMAGPLASVRTIKGLIGAGAAAGAGGGAVQFGEEGTLEERGKLAATGAAAGAVTAGALGGISSGISNALLRRELNKAVPSIEQLEQRADNLYSILDDAGAKIPKTQMKMLQYNAANRVEDIGGDVARGQTEVLHPKARRALEIIGDYTENPVSFREFEQMRRKVRSAMSTMDRDDRRVVANILDEVDKSFESLPQSVGGKAVSDQVKQARALWAKARKMESVADAIDNAAALDTGSKGIRNEFKKIIRNKNKFNRFNDAEKEAIKNIVKGSTSIEKMARHMGELFGITGTHAFSLLKGALVSGAGAAAGGPVGAVALPAVGQVSKFFAGRLQASNQRLLNEIIAVGPDAKEIARLYIRNVPKNKRSSSELARLLLARNANAKQLADSGNDLMAEAAWLAAKGTGVSAADMVSEEQ